MSPENLRAIAIEHGLLPPFFLPPITWNYQSNSLPSSLVADPHLFMPTALCMIAMILPYQPFSRRNDGQPDLPAYYLASNALYHFCVSLSKRCNDEKTPLLLAPLPAKGMLAQSGLAQIGLNSLAFLPEHGSRFAVQWMLSADWKPEPRKPSQKSSFSCKQCRQCMIACPTNAISEEGLIPARCLRYHMDGQIMPSWVKQNLNSLLGCDICQQVCPRNQDIATISMPLSLRKLFCYDRLLSLEPELYQETKKQCASLIGRNMLSKGRLPAQTFILARKETPDSFTESALYYQQMGNELQKDAAQYYLG